MKDGNSQSLAQIRIVSFSWGPQQTLMLAIFPHRGLSLGFFSGVAMRRSSRTDALKLWSVMTGWKHYKFPSEVPAWLDYDSWSTIFKGNPGLVLVCGVRFFCNLQFGDDWFLVSCLLTLSSSDGKLRRTKCPFICYLLHVRCHESCHLMRNFKGTENWQL